MSPFFAALRKALTNGGIQLCFPRSPLPLKVLLISLSLVGCAPQPERFTIEWREVSLAELSQICGEGTNNAPDLMGCQIDGFKVCKIYTLPKSVWEQRGDIDKYHIALGHEVRHCRDGWFHS